jgi:DNA-binding transcriptional LysR family regulator
MFFILCIPDRHTLAFAYNSTRRSGMMESNSLRAFLTIVDQGSFSEAAETLHLTQPAISKRLAALEVQLDAKLIDRSHRQIRLTDAGARLLPHARRILDEIHNARVALSPDSAQVEGELQIIASHHIGLHHLPNWLRRFTRDYPQVSLNLQFMESDAAYEQMRKRNAELAFVTLSDSMDPGFQVFAQWPDPMVFAAACDHPLTGLKNPELADLAAYPALLPDTSTATYRVVSRLFLEENVPLNPQMPTNYLETIKMMTSVGLGWSVLPASMVDKGLNPLKIRHPVARVLGGIGLSGRQLSNAARALLEIVRNQEAPDSTLKLPEHRRGN